MAAGALVAIALGLLLLSGGDTREPLVIHVIGAPAGLAVADGRVWVATPRTGSVAVLDAASGEPSIPPLKTGGAPVRLALGRHALWVADPEAAQVVPVQLRPWKVLPALRAGADAGDVALAGGAVWVASSADGRVYLLNDEGREDVRVGHSPVALAADERRVIVADSRDGTVTAIDANTRRPGRPVTVGGAPVDVALHGDTAWVADAAGGRIVAVDLRTARVLRAVDVGRRPIALAVAGEDVYVLTRELVRVRDGKVRSRRAVGPDPTALAVDGKYVWVASSDDTLRRFDR